jgi:hypothetical protein
MSATPDKRIAAIREKIAAERALLSDLNRRVGADLKKLFEPASDFLTDAEGWLTPQVLKHPPRSEREWARWLGFVEQILGYAVAHRKRVEALVKKYGPNARVVG